MASGISKYSFINAKLRARISGILPDDLFRQIAVASSLDAAFALLRETSFAELEKTYSETGDLKQVELDLLRNEIDLYRQIREFLDSGSRELVDSLLRRFEIDNLKNAIRVFFSRKIHKRADESSAHYILYETIIEKLPIDLIINAQNLDEIAGLCKGTPYAKIISQYAQEVESGGSLFHMEIALDHFYYGNLISSINKLDSGDREIALKLIGVEIDLQNIAWIIRFRHFYNLSKDEVLSAIIPGGLNLRKAVIDELCNVENATSALQGYVKEQYPGLSSLLSSQISDSTSQLMLIHRILDEIRKHEVQKILTGYPFTVGIILAYFILKSEELKKIRILLNAKQYGKSADKIESMI